MSHFYYRLLLIDDVESIWEESAARHHTLFRTGGSTFSEMPFFPAHSIQTQQKHEEIQRQLSSLRLW